MSIVIVTHTYATGPSQELESFLIKEKIKKLCFIGHPFSFSSDICSFYRLYESGVERRSGVAYPWKLLEILMYIKDILYTLYWIIFGKERYDLYIGVNNLNAFAGLILQRLRRAEKVLLYTIDYNPERFENKFLNSFYHWIDSFCVRHCNQVWNLSPVMITEREKKGVSHKFRSKQIIVPIGTDLSAERQPLGNIDRYTIAFMGHLREGQGVDFLISTLPDIIKRIPETKLVMIGGGPLEDQLKEYTKKLGISEHVEFLGFIKDHREALNRLAKCAVGVAPYVNDGKTYTRYTDPGKPKAYLAAGLPVVITRVPQIATEIERRKAGIAIEYDKGSLIQAIEEILLDPRKFITYKENAVKFACEFEWDMIFKRAFEESGIVCKEMP